MVRKTQHFHDARSKCGACGFVQTSSMGSKCTFCGSRALQVVQRDTPVHLDQRIPRPEPEINDV